MTQYVNVVQVALVRHSTLQSWAKNSCILVTMFVIIIVTMKWAFKVSLILFYFYVLQNKRNIQ